jgi:lipid-binding SYLF domain-containing protein
MKNPFTSIVIVAVVGLLVLPGLGCSKEEKAEVTPEVEVVKQEAPTADEPIPEASADEPEWKSMKQEAKATKIDEMAEETLEELFAENKKAKELYAGSYGWAAFDNLKLALGFSGGGGNGVAVNRQSGERTYMKMGTGGVGFGAGINKYQVIFLIEDSRTFDKFVNEGWQADAGATAAAGKSAAEVKTEFINGLAIYQLTEKGLMLNADLAGTKYWKNKKLND